MHQNQQRIEKSNANSKHHAYSSYVTCAAKTKTTAAALRYRITTGVQSAFGHQQRQQQTRGGGNVHWWRQTKQKRAL